MSKLTRRKSKYFVKTQPAEVKKVELEVKEVEINYVDDFNITIFLKFTNNASYRLKLKSWWEYQHGQKWSEIKKGDKVVAFVKAMKIIKII